MLTINISTSGFIHMNTHTIVKFLDLPKHRIVY